MCYEDMKKVSDHDWDKNLVPSTWIWTFLGADEVANNKKEPNIFFKKKTETGRNAVAINITIGEMTCIEIIIILDKYISINKILFYVIYLK